MLETGQPGLSWLQQADASSMKILFVTFGLPAQSGSGAHLRDFNLIRRVARRHQVSVLSLLEFPDEMDHASALQAFCEHVDGVVADRSWLGDARTALGGLLRGRPAATAPFYYPELARRIRHLTAARQFDLIQIEHSFLAPYRSAVAPAFRGAAVLSFHNVGVHQYRSMLDMSRGLARLPAALKWLSLRGWEARAARRFDHCIVVSAPDRERLRAMGVGENITIIENGVDCALLQVLADPPAGADEILFIGTMGYLPNRDGIRWFCREILPLVHARRPACRLTIVGFGGREYLAKLAQPGIVEIAGRVDDPSLFYQRARLAIAPLRSGGGSRLKVLEAMALGRPVVATRVGCEGLELEPGKDLQIADEPKAFAAAVIAMLTDDERWHCVTRAARRKVATRYDWNLAAERLLSLYTQLRAEPVRAQGQSTMPPSLIARPGTPQLSVIIPVYNAKATLAECLDALARSQQRNFELIVIDDHSTDGGEEIARARCDQFVRLKRNFGQAAARNRGARRAAGDVLFFLDADVLVQPDTLDRILEVFAREPGVAATFCSYQPDTPSKNFISKYKNLLHHYTHQTSRREAATFCGGFGAIRRDVFLAAGGFSERFRFMEDVELGYRLHKTGCRILLSPEIQLTHTKHYTLASLIRADVLHRALPWTKIMLAQRVFRSDLNLRPNNLASTFIVYLMLLAPFLPLSLPLVESALAIVFAGLNWRFLRFLWRRRGFVFAARAAPMLWLQYGYSSAGLVLGVLGYLKERLIQRKSTPGVKADEV